VKTIINNGQVLNVHTSQYEKKNIVIESDKITGLADSPVTGEKGDVVIDAAGKYIIPGLIDAHVHITSATVDLATPQLPITYTTCCAAKNLADALLRGFTTMRDVGGADFGLAMAVNNGMVKGSRLFYCGRALSQTGGHGDFRAMTYDGEYGAPMQSSATTIGQIADGVTEVRRACRSELRKNASFIKIMAAGGVASPDDRLTDTQFSGEELTAIYEEAQAKSTYIAAHVLSPKAIQICLKYGVRSIEHGNLLDEETAVMMKEKGAYLIPTIITYDALARRGADYQFPEESIKKLGSVRVQALEAVKIARRHGIKIGFGTDLLGPLWEEQINEFTLRSTIEKPIDTIISATKINAEVLNQSGNLGEISEQAFADILILGKDPLKEITAITDNRNIQVIMKAGTIYKNTL